MNADEALTVWHKLNYNERCYAVGILAWNNPDAMIDAAKAARESELVDHTPDDE